MPKKPRYDLRNFWPWYSRQLPTRGGHAEPPPFRLGDLHEQEVPLVAGPPPRSLVFSVPPSWLARSSGRSFDERCLRLDGRTALHINLSDGWWTKRLSLNLYAMRAVSRGIIMITALTIGPLPPLVLFTMVASALGLNWVSWGLGAVATAWIRLFAPWMSLGNFGSLVAVSLWGTVGAAIGLFTTGSDVRQLARVTSTVMLVCGLTMQFVMSAAGVAPAPFTFW
jgi:hypothetical protein